MDYKQKYAEYLALAEKRIGELAPVLLPQTSEVGRAAMYSLTGGGKRVRAISVLAACEMLGGDIQSAADFAVAVEMLHCYSLIHDDLPCMDDDDFRRGRPSCHKAFGEATALLAGDTLQAAAFEAIGGAPLSAEARIKAVQQLSNAAGDRGMVYGQEIDLFYESRQATEDELKTIHHYKTGALINAAVQMGASAAGATLDDHAALEKFAFAIGLVFQIVDDVLDVTSTQEELGKPIGSDSENGKTTYITLHGAEGAMALAAAINEKACAELKERYGEKAAFLLSLSNNLLSRRN